MTHPTFLACILAGAALAAQPAPPDGPRPPRPPQQEAAGGHRPGPAGPHHPGPGLPFQALDLSPDQQAAMKACLERHRAAQETLHRTALDQEEALRAAAEDPATPEAQLRTLAAAAAEAHLKSLLAHRALVQELDGLLTPEQRAKAKRIRDNQRREREAHRAVMEDLEPAGRPAPPRP